MSDPVLEEGWIDSELAADFPALSLTYTRVDAGSGRSPEPVRRRMRTLASRITGGHVVHMRQDTVPWAFRVFWRQIGLDPDTDRTPVEAIALERLRHGGLKSRNLLDDAIVIATLETGVPVVAFDAARVGTALGLRLARDDELLGGNGRPLSARQIVYSDEHHGLAIIDGEVAPEHGVTPATERMVLAAPAVSGVPRIAVEEALWTVADVVTSG